MLAPERFKSFYNFSAGIGALSVPIITIMGVLDLNGQQQKKEFDQQVKVKYIEIALSLLNNKDKSDPNSTAVRAWALDVIKRNRPEGVPEIPDDVQKAIRDEKGLTSDPYMTRGHIDVAPDPYMGVATQQHDQPSKQPRSSNKSEQK